MGRRRRRRRRVPAGARVYLWGRPQARVRHRGRRRFRLRKRWDNRMEEGRARAGTSDESVSQAPRQPRASCPLPGSRPAVLPSRGAGRGSSCRPGLRSARCFLSFFLNVPARHATTWTDRQRELGAPGLCAGRARAPMFGVLSSVSGARPADRRGVRARSQSRVPVQ